MTENCELKSCRLQIRGENLSKYGTLTASSESGSGRPSTQSKMIDDDPMTFWHSKESKRSWVRYLFNNEQVVFKISIIRRGNKTF